MWPWRFQGSAPQVWLMRASCYLNSRGELKLLLKLLTSRFWLLIIRLLSANAAQLSGEELILLTLRSRLTLMSVSDYWSWQLWTRSLCLLQLVLLACLIISYIVSLEQLLHERRHIFVLYRQESRPDVYSNASNSVRLHSGEMRPC